MATTGPKPLPTNIRKLRGNPGKRALPDAEPQPKAVIPKPPEHVQGESRKEWFRISKQLYDIGCLTEVDRAMLAAYCVAWGRWVEAEENIRKYGTVMLSPDKGWPVQSPYLSIANRAMEQMVKFLAEFGMSPSSRSRITTSKSEKTGDPLEEWMRGSSRTG